MGIVGETVSSFGKVILLIFSSQTSIDPIDPLSITHINYKYQTYLARASLFSARTTKVVRAEVCAAERRTANGRAVKASVACIFPGLKNLRILKYIVVLENVAMVGASL